MDENFQNEVLHHADLEMSSLNIESNEKLNEKIIENYINFNNKTSDNDTCDNTMTSIVNNSDIGHFLEFPIDNTLRKKVIANGPHQPKGPFPKDPVSNRSFSCDYYYINTKAGQKIDRKWLCYSNVLDGVYCQVCWLFANRHDQNFHSAWTKGTLNDWQSLSKKIKIHEHSNIHLNACLAYSNFLNEKNVIIGSLCNESESWKEVLIIILDVLLTLAMNNITLRGHRENPKNINNSSGNFLNIIDLLSRYSSRLKEHLENPENKIKHLSPAVQNELLELAANKTLKTILNYILQSPFFSLILDTTQDKSKKDQLSILLRYLIIEPNKKIQIHESFLGFFHVVDSGAEKMTEVVLDFLKNQKIDIKKCRGQGYDGAPVMSGPYTGIQARLKDIAPTAEYVHCCCHNLNLVLNDSVNKITEIKSFYEILSELYSFFSNSLPRWQMLIDGGSKNKKGILLHALKKLCPTRWSSRYDSILAFKNNFSLVLNCLTTIILLSKDKKEVDAAQSLQKKISKFDFVIILVFQSRVLSQVNLVSKIMQHDDAKLDETCNLLKNILIYFKEMRTDFESLKTEATCVASTWNIEPKLPEKQNRLVKKFHEELAADTSFSDPFKKFKIQVYNASLDITIRQLQDRFEGMNAINKNFSFLTPKSLLNLTDEELISAAYKLSEKYSDDIDMCISTEIISFRNLIKPYIESKSNVRTIDLANYLNADNYILVSSLSNICTAYFLYLTLPVTSASAERSFSKLKIILNYLTSTMSQTRLSSIAMLSIENEVARNLDLKEIIEDYLSIKKRRGLK